MRKGNHSEHLKYQFPGDLLFMVEVAIYLNLSESERCALRAIGGWDAVIKAALCCMARHCHKPEAVGC